MTSQPTTSTGNAHHAPAAAEDDPQQIMEAMFSTLLKQSNMSDTFANMDLDSILHPKTNTDGAPTGSTPTGIEDITSKLDALDDDSVPHSVQQDITDLIRQRANHLTLQVKYESEAIAEMYATDTNPSTTDSGWDLRFTEDCTIQPGETKKFDFGVCVSCYDEEYEGNAVWLLPRSSIVKTPLRMANSVGLIDSSYRGTLKAYVDNVKSEPFSVKKGDRLFQVASQSLKPFRIQVVKELSETERGENGFGSTGV